MQFRQGAGRLIRTKTDKGVITVLDSRILHKAYGRLFLDCLPQKRFERMTVENREEVFRPFKCRSGWNRVVNYRCTQMNPSGSELVRRQIHQFAANFNCGSLNLCASV